jgi:predicted Zn-dependent peptidase
MFVAYSGSDVGTLKEYVDAGLRAMRTPLSKNAFAAALAAFKYHLLSDLQTPAQMADNFGWYSVEGNPEYAPGAAGESGKYFTAANSLTADFVAQVATTYLGKQPATVALGPDFKPQKRTDVKDPKSQ